MLANVSACSSATLLPPRSPCVARRPPTHAHTRTHTPLLAAHYCRIAPPKILFLVSAYLFLTKHLPFFFPCQLFCPCFHSVLLPSYSPFQANQYTFAQPSNRSYRSERPLASSCSLSCYRGPCLVSQFPSVRPKKPTTRPASLVSRHTSNPKVVGNGFFQSMNGHPSLPPLSTLDCLCR
ncbi:hypothetical protein IF1G_02137 [Cordyceps javanica]|uniref:Uncharacterized protein n=1 Tax=Cordyceps javanica TaxID=43265 RepID=A0A545VDY0_9HYPO|nr:hypothetical protein IF1G_02137 [Cordyceps javanica]